MKRGERVSFSHAEGGHTKFWGVVCMWYLEVLAILKGGTKNLQWGGGGGKSFTLSGEGCKKFGTRNFPIL